MKKKINEVIYQVARYMEIAFSSIILIVIAIMVVPILHELFQTPFLSMDKAYFNEFLATSLTLVVGVEFVKMLCKHTAETVLEVLMFATARQMVVEHMKPLEILTGVIAIAVLFAVRKYLLIHTEGTKVTDKL